MRAVRASTAAAATRLVIGLLLALVLLPPAGVAALGWLTLSSSAGDQAAAIAWAIAEGHRVDARKLHGLVPASAVAEPERWIALLDAKGEVRLQSSPPLPWPTLEATRALAQPQPDLASVRLARPLGPLLAHAALAALGGATFALGLWWLVFRRPVSRLERAEGQIRSFAGRDGLTGLLNREGLRERAARALDRAGRQGAAIGVVLVDLDRFNLVNGSLGQAGGDWLLCAAADRLRAIVRQGDGLARITGDQFAVLVEGISTPDVLGAMARNMLRAFEAPFVLGGRELVVSFSAGGVLGEPAAATVDDLLGQAGAAMRAAKAAGGARFRLFEATMGDDAPQRLDLDLRLRRALSAGQFFLLYQPIVEAGSRRTVAVEALLRWAAPGQGTVPPAEFIPVLEQTGLIVPVGHWVLHEACRRGAQWRREGAPEIVLSVNISPRLFAEPDFVQRVRGNLLSTGFPAAQLQIEVTEGLLLEPTPATLRRIAELAEMGVRLAVDDFGMGYSSLAYLKRFPLHGLKIDRMFVLDIARREQDRAIARAIVDLGHGLGLKVTAEGVETEDQAEALHRMGCDALQGFLFARPTAADDLALTEVVQASGSACAAAVLATA